MYDSLSDNAASYKATLAAALTLCRMHGRITVTDIHQMLPQYSHSTILSAVGRAVANGHFVRTGPFTIALAGGKTKTATKKITKKITKKKTAAKKATKKPAIEKKPMTTTFTIIDRLTRIERMLGV